MKRFNPIGWIVVVLFLLGFQGSAQAADKVKIILDWFLNANHESLLAAQYSGAFQRYNLDVEFIAPADPGTPPRLLAAGQADLAISYPTQLAMMVDQHIPLMRVGTLIDTPMNCLVLGPELHSIADLKGKKLGVALAGDEKSILQTLLMKYGLKLSDIQIINVNFQLEQALMTGAVDAIIGAARNYEWLDLQQRHFKATAFYPEEEGVPISDELIFLARKDEANDPKIRRFMQALQEGTNYLLNHPQEILEKAIKDHPELNTPLNRAAWEVTLPRVAKSPGLLDAERYQKFTTFLYKRGVIHQDFPLSTYTVDTTKVGVHQF